MALGSGLRRNDEIGSCWASQPPAGYSAARLTRPTRWRHRTRRNVVIPGLSAVIAGRTRNRYRGPCRGSNRL